MNNEPTPTGLPGQPGITHHTPVQVPAPAPALAPELYAAPTGKLFQVVGINDAGRLLIPAESDPATCPKWVWAAESDLVEAFGAPLVRVERAA